MGERRENDGMRTGERVRVYSCPCGSVSVSVLKGKSRMDGQGNWIEMKCLTFARKTLFEMVFVMLHMLFIVFFFL